VSEEASLALCVQSKNVSESVNEKVRMKMYSVELAGLSVVLPFWHGSGIELTAGPAIPAIQDKPPIKVSRIPRNANKVENVFTHATHALPPISLLARKARQYP